MMTSVPHRTIADVELCEPSGAGADGAGAAHSSSSSSSSSGTSSAPANDVATAGGKADFLEKVRQSNAACQSGDFKLAIQLYSEALSLDPGNHVLHANRSAAYIKLGKHQLALQDAVKARKLNPKWPKAYYRQGVALQCLGRHADALASFSSGLAQDPKNSQLLAGLVEAAMKSPLRATLEPIYLQLQTMQLDKSPFVIISVIGQELLAAGHSTAAVVVLEAALTVGTCSLKLRGSVFSALSSAYWALNSLDKAVSYMQQDLAVAKSLGDVAGECRAHGNLGAAYFWKRNHRDSLTSHRYQLVLAMKCKDTQAAAMALTSLGHVYTAIGDYPNALASHKQCVQLLRPLGDRVQEAREIGHVGTVYLAMGELEKAVECHMEHLRIAKQLGNRVEEARAYSNLGSSHHYRRDLKPAITCHNHVLRIALEIGDKVIEARAYAGLGHAARCMSDYSQAKRWHEKQLDMALAMKDKVGEGRACSNLGIVYQLQGEHDAALKLHQAHLNVARALHDLAGMGRAYGNIGNACSAMGLEELAIKYHKQELAISKEVNDRSSEASTHGNLAVSYQALGMFDLALLHYRSHLNIARELKDSAGESCALLNLGNCHSSRADFAQAVPYYESHLMLSQEMHDVEGEAKACHVLGYAHYRLGNYKEAIRYYNQDLALARDLQDSTNIARAYCNLGLAHLALGNHQCALECQRHFLEIAQMMKHVQGMFRAMGNIGDALMKIGNTDEAVQVYHKQLLLAKQSRDKGLEAGAYGALGVAHRLLAFHDKALGYHTQELTLRQELNDVRGECKAHGHLGAVHVALASYTYAMKCYEEQLERAHELKDSVLEAQAFGNLGFTRLSMGHIEDAIGFFEQQLATLEQVPGNLALTDKGRAYANLGDCYDALCDFDEAVKCHEQYLSVALKVKNRKDQERAYRRLGNSNKCLGNLHQALVCFEKRLVVAHELDQPSSKATAYGDLGQVHTMMAQYGQAISCLEHQLTISKESGERTAEADATCGLGIVYQQMGEYKRAMQYHRMDLHIAEETGNLSAQGRACGNLGVTHESLEDLETAIAYQEQHLSIAAQINDRVAKMSAFSSLGRIHHAMGAAAQSVAYLQQGLQIAEQLSRREDEAKIRHRLGLALWTHEDLEGAQQQLYRAADLFESIRRECRSSTDYKLSLFDLQTASYQALQRVLIILGRHEEALVVAERSRTRAFVDLLLERQANGGVGAVAGLSQMNDATPASLERFLDNINRQKATVLYFSMAAGFLYSWLIVPTKGVVKFHECNLNNVAEANCGGDSDRVAESDSDNTVSITADSHLAQYVQSVREALGVEALTSSSVKCGMGAGDADNEVGDAWQQQHLEELGDKLNQEGDRLGFLRMVNRSHLLNGSNYSLSSLGSWNGSSSVTSSTRSRRPTPWPGPACVRELYGLLLAPVEDHLPVSGAQKELALVLEGDLFLVPFPLLKGGIENDYLCERFDLLVAPSASVLRCGGAKRPKPPKTLPATVVAGAGRTSGDEVTGLVVGNPRLPSCVAEQWGWGDIPYAEQEANCVADILGVRAVVGPEATKDAVLREISQVECVHLATHVSWKLSALVMSPGDVAEPSSKVMSNQDNDVEGSEAASSSLELPSLSEFLLTAADILNLRLSAKLVVLSACHTRNHHGAVHADGIVGFVRSLLAAGAQCVLVCLWPVPDTAVKILMRTFYSSLLQGSRVSRSLSVAMENVRQRFPHPANWGGFMLVGCDVKLSSKVALMGQALCELLKTPDACRDALRVVLHLTEKSLQRIHRGHRNAMYTTQRSIEKKVGTADGWKDLLISVGFRFEPAANSIPASVFFPQSDPGERLTQCSASLQALLGLSQTSLQALSKLLSSPETADGIVKLLRQGSSQMCLTEVEAEGIEIPVNVKLWRVPGCHELLASLGFDLTDVGRDEVVLRTGKQASKRSFEFASQALLALFDTQEAPRSLALDESSSTESLARSSDEESNQGTPPLPRPRTDVFGLGQRAEGIGLKTTMGAFSAYVQAKNTRGEPDGRTTISTANGGGGGGGSGGTGPVIKGRDNDAFTPSPVEPVPKPQRELVCAPAARSNLALSMSGLDLEDNSIASCWESGLSTVRRQDKSEAVVDLGPQRPRRNLGFVPAVESTGPRLPPRNPPLPCDNPHATSGTPYVSPYETVDLLGVTRIRPLMSTAEPDKLPPPLPPPPIPGSRKPGHLSIQEREDRGRFLTAQVNRLNRDPAIISDVYNDRNVGLGLAPPLSKLLFPNNDVVVAAVTRNKLDDSNVTVTALPPPPPHPPPVPAKRASAASLKHHQPQRDEGDGHSMTESTYGAWTPTGQRPKVDNIQSPGSSFTLYKPPPHSRGGKVFHDTVQEAAVVDSARHKHHQEVATYVDKVLASTKLQTRQQQDEKEKDEPVTRGKQAAASRNRVQRVVM